MEGHFLRQCLSTVSGSTVQKAPVSLDSCVFFLPGAKERNGDVQGLSWYKKKKQHQALSPSQNAQWLPLWLLLTGAISHRLSGEGEGLKTT